MFIKTVRYRRLGTALVTLGGGLGWIIILFGKSSWLGSLPVEFISPDAFGFLSLFGLAHLALARAFMLWSLRSYLQAGQQTQPRAAWAGSIRTGVFLLLAALAQPLTGMLAGAVLVLHLLITGLYRLISPGSTLDGAVWKAYFKHLVIAGIIAGPFALYNLLVFTLDPFLKAWNQQSYIPSPNPALYLLAYGLALPFACIGARRLLQQNFWQGIFLVAWIPASLLAIYVPFSQQRRFLDGVSVDLGGSGGHRTGG